jgi:hypothetical protein
MLARELERERREKDEKRRGGGGSEKEQGKAHLTQLSILMFMAFRLIR